MQTAFLNETLAYDGSQLRAHFAFSYLGILGDSCVAFVGPCRVTVDDLVDLEDVRKAAPIYSPNMLHFIVESFALELRAAVAFQRLMVARVGELLQSSGVQRLFRQGDDLFRGPQKLSVSIATRSLVSSLIHLGINIQTEGTPVPTVGLAELQIGAEKFGRLCLQAFAEEYDGMLRAACKVRGV